MVCTRIKILFKLSFIFFIVLIVSVQAQNSIYISPAPAFMGKVPLGSSSDRSISILNNSSSQINITNITISGTDAANFVISNNPNSYTLPPLENLILNITYTPTSTGQDIAILQIKTGAGTAQDSLIGYGSVIINGVPTFERVFGITEDVSSGSLKQSADGGYIVVGTKKLLDSNRRDEAYVLKTDKYGREEWTKLIGGNRDDIGQDVVALNDGSSAVVGQTQSFSQAGDPNAIYLFKIDSQGTLLWQKVLGGMFEDIASRIIQTSDGGFIIVGNTKTSTFASTDAYVIKTDSEGNVQWSKTYGGQYGESAFDITSTYDGGYIFVGFYQESLNPDVYLVKIDASGNELWSKTFSTPYPDEGRSINRTNDGGYIIAGYTTGPNASDGYLLKINSEGVQQWSKSYGGPHPDYFSSVVQTPDGGYLCAGAVNQYFSQQFIYNDVYLVKTDSEGNVMSEKQYGGALEDFAKGMIKTQEGGYIIAGSTISFNDTEQVYLLGVDVNGNITEVKKNENSTIPNNYSLSQNYPNPFNPSTIIQFTIPPLGDQNSNYVSLKIYDVLGNEVKTLVDGELTPGNYLVEFNATNIVGHTLSSGIYFYRLIGGSFSITKKMIFLK